ncbi:unnamed protein product [Discula destructiva]
MPAMLDDPSSPTIYRVNGEAPYPGPSSPLPPNILPRQVTLRDRQTVATIVPFASKDQVPPSLLLYLSDQLAKEIEKGDTYPMIESMPHDKFATYWFQNFGAIMLLGSIEKPEDVVEGKDWAKECLGSFYIKPNYPGRSSHVCNAGFLVTDASRNRGVGRLMGEAYLDWAPKLGYTYSVFNLVYETNVASCRIWDALGFKRIGRVPGCGKLKSYPDRFVDAIIYGRDLTLGEEDNDELVSEERFEKIKFYLKHGKYPNGADRAEKSRLRSAATHYKLLDNDVLMLKDKEVISDPASQYDIARQTHALGQHAGINKTTATITEKYHWRGIKDTVSDVIRLCGECEDKSNGGMVKPATPIQTSAQHPSAVSAPVPAASPAPVPLSADDRASQMTHHRDVPPDPILVHQEATRPELTAYNHDEPPIDPQIMSQAYSDLPTQTLHSAYGQDQRDQPLYFDSHAEMDLDPEAHALQQLLNATSPAYDEVNRGITDRDLELMLTKQLEEDVGTGARMDVDDAHNHDR